MTQPAKASEPSMEEILASIRRIIADDDATKSTPQPADAPKPAVEPARPAAPPRVAAVPPPPPAPASMPEPSAFDEPEPPPPPADDKEDSRAGDILDLTESMAAAAPSAPPVAPVPQFRTIDADSDVDFDEVPEPPAPPPLQMKPAKAEQSPQLLSANTSAAVDSAFNSLAQTVLVQNARTLEDLVREMLRPLLKSWLDDNLPGLVERLVRTEIERVSRGR
jgi:uncharacterized protein